MRQVGPDERAACLRLLRIGTVTRREQRSSEAMARERIELIEPAETLQEAYLDFLEDFRAAGEQQVPGMGWMAKESLADFIQYVRDSANFADFVRRLRNHAKGIDLPADWVPASTYWLVRDGVILGTCNIRHSLTEALRDFGGHIGYSVRPSQRRRGYATVMLRLALARARRLGIRRVFVTCARDNVASARVIQKNGGLLDSEGYSPRAGCVTQRYWIDLTAPEDTP